MITRFTKPTLQVIVINFIYLFGAMTENSMIRLLATVIWLVCIFTEDMISSSQIMVGLSINQALVAITSDSFSLLGIGYLVFIVKIVFLNRKSDKILIPIKLGVSSIIVVSVALLHFVKFSSYYDFLLIVELLVVMCVYIHIFKYYSKNQLIKLYDAFILGALLCSINSIIYMFFAGNYGERLGGVFDNPNYLAISYGIAAVCSLICYCYRIQTKKNILLFIYFTILLLSTGSRGAAISLICIIMYIIVFGFQKVKKVRSLFIVIVSGIIVLCIMYYANVQFVVAIYDNLIGRTIELLYAGNTSQFMDVSSGRLTLWSYYIEKLTSDLNIFLFGIGSDRYYLVEYGGYGLVVHNFILGSVMGIGVIGTVGIINMYIQFYKNITKVITLPYRINKLNLSIIFMFVIGYFFLDGLLDLRIIIYIIMMVLVGIKFEETKNDIQKNID